MVKSTAMIPLLVTSLLAFAFGANYPSPVVQQRTNGAEFLKEPTIIEDALRVDIQRTKPHLIKPDTQIELSGDWQADDKCWPSWPGAKADLPGVFNCPPPRRKVLVVPKLVVETDRFANISLDFVRLTGDTQNVKIDVAPNLRQLSFELGPTGLIFVSGVITTQGELLFSVKIYTKTDRTRPYAVYGRIKAEAASKDEQAEKDKIRVSFLSRLKPENRTIAAIKCAAAVFGLQPWELAQVRKFEDEEQLPVVEAKIKLNSRACKAYSQASCADVRVVDFNRTVCGDVWSNPDNGVSSGEDQDGQEVASLNPGLDGDDERTLSSDNNDEDLNEEGQSSGAADTNSSGGAPESPYYTDPIETPATPGRQSTLIARILSTPMPAITDPPASPSTSTVRNFFGSSRALGTSARTDDVLTSEKPWASSEASSTVPEIKTLDSSTSDLESNGVDESSVSVMFEKMGNALSRWWRDSRGPMLIVFGCCALCIVVFVVFCYKLFLSKRRFGYESVTVPSPLKHGSLDPDASGFLKR